MDLQSLKIERSPAAAATKRRRGSPWPMRLIGLGGLLLLAWVFARPLSDFVDRLRLPTVRTCVTTEAAPAAAASVRGTAANGYLVAARRAALSSDVPGRIVELNVREGSVVKRGDVVARLFSAEFRASLARAEAELGTAGAQVQRARANALAAAADVAQADKALGAAQAQQQEGTALLRWVELEHRRASELQEGGIGAPRDVDRTRSELDAQKARAAVQTANVATSTTAAATARAREAVATADVGIAEAQLLTATAARNLAQATLDKTDVRAPFDGIVVLKDAEVGEVVSPNVQGGNNARGAVCTMVDFASLEVQANVPETTLASVRLGAPVDVFLDAFPDDRLAGTVDRIWPTADRQKATVEVRIKLARIDERLRPEMGVRIVFRAADAEAPTPDAAAPKQIFVPEPVLVPIDGKLGVFVVERDVVRFTPVTIGERKNGRAAIAAGLVRDQRLVLDPPASLQDGDRIRIADQ